MELKRRNIRNTNRSNKTKISSGGRGRVPRTPRSSNFTTGGENNPRNRKWILKRKIGKIIAIVHSDQNNPSRIQKSNDIPCKIYLDTNDVKLAEKFYESLKNVLKTVELEISKENKAKLGSWLKNFWLGTKGFTDKEIVTRLEKVERGIELQYIDKVQSEVDLNTANAIGILLQNTKDIPHFSSLVGSLLFAKTTLNGEPIIFAQTLTQEQLVIIKENPSLLQRPFDLITKMEEEKTRVLSENKQKKLEGN